jgi:hypothetical protein
MEARALPARAFTFLKPFDRRRALRMSDFAPPYWHRRSSNRSSREVLTEAEREPHFLSVSPGGIGARSNPLRQLDLSGQFVFQLLLCW